MSKRGIKGLRRRPASSREGVALVSVLVVFVSLAGLAYAALMTSTIEVNESRRSVDKVRTKFLAESGYERGLEYLASAVSHNALGNPLDGINGLFAGGESVTPYLGEPVLQGPTQVGAYSVTINRVAQTADSVDIEIKSTGYLPLAPGALASGQALGDWEAISVTVHYELGPSSVFDYAYFINNWGWFYGNTINAHGNVRSNGQFDVANYTPLVAGQALYDSVNWDGTTASLVGYQDDNEDGLMDGNDGGVWSAWDILRASGLQGNGGKAPNQHEFSESVPMPNLTDLSGYEEAAIANNTTLSIGGVQVSDAVFGDDAGETGNLYLEGTLADPIELNGSIVAQGDVIIKGYVTGQGAIYSGGNIYCPESVMYVNGPGNPLPEGLTQAESEAWLADNWGDDFLGLFAKESIVAGDFTDNTWRYYVGHWMANSLNKSIEDAGEDGIPNTYAGLDGIVGTADDDVLEGDGIFTIEYYTQQDLELGLIPEGSSVDDPIPGTGEDIDGDGVFDDGITLSDLDLPGSLNQGTWGGNMPVAGFGDYSDISSLYANQLDAVLYTNHTFCQTVLGSDPMVINGALVSRNEDVVYGTPAFDINYDIRLLGGNSGMAGDLLPQTLNAPRITRWEVLRNDPNRYIEVQP